LLPEKLFCLVLILDFTKMVSKVMGPIPTQQTYEKSDPETYMKVAFSNVKSDAEGLGKQGCGSLCLAVEVDRATMPSAFRKTSMNFVSLFKNVRLH
jgi:hypothetical protein